ncbi:bifunctional aminoglycoside phosphotransferase/ATP-binding protein [Gordonia sp. NPDC003376]
MTILGTDPTTETLTRAGILDPDIKTTRIVTHGAVIFLNGDRAWKMKRPVRYRYLDFSTPALRHDALDAELRLNRRIAPDVYLGLHEVTGEDGLDWVLEMTRFDDDALLVTHAQAGTLDDTLLRRLAERTVELHAASEICPDPHGAARIQEVVDGNLGSMSAFPEILDPPRATLLTDRLTAMIAANADLLDARARAGRVRHGHGDLHMGNIAVIDGEPVPFDCLEFDAEMATTDVLYDIAFLVMDLWARGLRHEANVVINTYLDLSPDDEDGFALMPILLSVRATVRAHVGAAAGAIDHARDYLDLALAFTDPEPARLIAIGGGSGTGKTTVARAVGGDLAPAPGARILRSDVLRKRLAGVSAETRLPASGYTPEMGARVYAELNRLAGDDLTAGMSVIADAVFGRAVHREAIEAVADGCGCGFVGIWLELDEAERISRIEARGADASDADAAVARRQTQSLQAPGTEWAHIDAGAGSLDRIRRELGRPETTESSDRSPYSRID